MLNINTHTTYNNKQCITHKYSLLLYVKNRCFVHIRTSYIYGQTHKVSLLVSAAADDGDAHIEVNSRI